MKDGVTQESFNLPNRDYVEARHRATFSPMRRAPDGVHAAGVSCCLHQNLRCIDAIAIYHAVRYPGERHLPKERGDNRPQLYDSEA